MLKALQKFVWLRSVWVAVIGVLIHYHYTSTNPTLVVWEGHVLIVSWVLLQCFLVEVTLISFKDTPANQIDPLDVILAVILAVCFAAVTLSVGVDMLPTNSLSHIYTTPSILPAYQCDSIIQIAENHAWMHLQDTLAGYDEINTTSTRMRESIEAARQKSILSGGWLTDRHAKYPTTDMSAYAIRQNITLYPASTEAVATGGAEGSSVDFVTWLNSTVENTIFPILKRQFDLSDAADGTPVLSMKDLFIVKYSADSPHSQRHLELHTDSSQISFNIALSTHLPEADPASLDSTDADQTCTEEVLSETVSDPDSRLPGTGSGVDERPACRQGDSGNGNGNGNGTSSAYSGGGTYILRSDSVVHTARGTMLSHPSRIHHAGAPITSGTRYLLVGFVNVQRTWRTFHRRHGMFSRCVSFSTLDASSQDVGASTGKAAGKSVLKGDPAALFAEAAGDAVEDVHCQWYAWVLAYDLAEIIKQPFLNAKKSGRSAMLAVVLGITVLAAVLAVISACALLFTSATEESEGAKKKVVPKPAVANTSSR